MESVWDYPRPPRLEHSTARITVLHAGRTIVSSTRCLRVLETSHPPVYYVPRADIAPGVLVPGAGRSVCEFKGVAGYWDLLPEAAPVSGSGSASQAGFTSQAGPPAPADRVPQVGWSYERPVAAYTELAGAVAFYPSRVDECRVDGELVRPQEGDFYGGWITDDITGPFKGAPGTMGW